MPAPGHLTRSRDHRTVSGTRRTDPTGIPRPRSGHSPGAAGSPVQDAAQRHQAAVPDKLISEYLDRILSSAEFKSAPQLQAFLRFIVDAELNNRTQDLKGYTIAVEALGRHPDFDPNTDPIVRVEAARLRSRLDKYYFGTGTDDPVRITVPKGGYTPVFEVIGSPAGQSGPVSLGQPASPEPTATPRTRAEQDSPQTAFEISKDEVVPLQARMRAFLLEPRISTLWLSITAGLCLLAGFLAGRG